MTAEQATPDISNWKLQHKREGHMFSGGGPEGIWGPDGVWQHRWEAVAAAEAVADIDYWVHHPFNDFAEFGNAHSTPHICTTGMAGDRHLARWQLTASRHDVSARYRHGRAERHRPANEFWSSIEKAERWFQAAYPGVNIELLQASDGYYYPRPVTVTVAAADPVADDEVAAVTDQVLSAAPSDDVEADGWAPEGWTIELDDFAAAEWAAGRVAEAHQLAEKRVAHALTQAAALRARADELDEWVETIRAAEQRRVSALRVGLQEWARARLAADPDGPKTIKLSSGAVKSSIPRRRVRVIDADQVVASLSPAEVEQIITTETKVALAPLKDLVFRQGVKVDGIEVIDPTEADRTFTVVID